MCAELFQISKICTLKSNNKFALPYPEIVYIFMTEIIFSDFCFLFLDNTTSIMGDDGLVKSRILDDNSEISPFPENNDENLADQPDGDGNFFFTKHFLVGFHSKK